MSPNDDGQRPKDKELWRDLSSFWILGLCTNFNYHVMLNAAHDIIARFSVGEAIRAYGRAGKTRQCYYMSTGAILLADIMPSLIAKMTMPFIPFCINIRITFAVIFSMVSLILVAYAENVSTAIVGVILTSFSAGMGEATFMSYSSNFHKNVVSTWSSGTGGAGIFGSVAYASMIGFGISPRKTMLIMLIVPLIEAAAFWILLRNPKDIPPIEHTDFDEEEMANDVALATLKEKILYIPELLKYMLPLTAVYFFEYFINQGLYELIYFKNIFLDKPAQYRWLNVDYQIGVFIARSSVNVVHFRQIWLMSVFQFLNVIYFLTEAIYFYTPSIWITFTVALFEGLLGGGAYVNTFYRMSQEITPKRRRHALAIVIQADSFGILLAGIFAIPVHDAICGLPIMLRTVTW